MQAKQEPLFTTHLELLEEVHGHKWLWVIATGQELLLLQAVKKPWTSIEELQTRVSLYF